MMMLRTCFEHVLYYREAISLKFSIQEQRKGAILHLINKHV